MWHIEFFNFPRKKKKKIHYSLSLNPILKITLSLSPSPPENQLFSILEKSRPIYFPLLLLLAPFARTRGLRVIINHTSTSCEGKEISSLPCPVGICQIAQLLSKEKKRKEDLSGKTLRGIRRRALIKL